MLNCSCLLTRLAAAMVVLAPTALLAQAELVYPIPGGLFTVDRFSVANHRSIPEGLQIVPLDRKDVFMSSHLLLPQGKDSEITRIVVRFRDPKNSNARLTSILLTDQNGNKLLDQVSYATGDHSSRETYAPDPSPNGWKFPVSTRGTRVNVRTTVRLGIDSPIGFEGGSGEPFVLFEVDVYIKNPAVDRPAPTGTATSSTPPARLVPTPAPLPSGSNPAPARVIANLPDSAGVIYTINDTKQLLWYRHEGRAAGSFSWAASTGSQVGTGWDFRTVLGAGHGVLYAVTRDGDLLWYRHTGAGDGSFSWAQDVGQKVNSGFAGMQVVAAGNGVLYGLKRNGDLLWFRHDGYVDGTDRWTGREGRLIASNWPASHIFAGDGGTLYAVRRGELYRYRHDGQADGSAVWADPAGQKIASNWDFPIVFSSGGGIIYAVNPERQLLWFQDQGYADASVRWANGGTPKVVGVGWQFTNVFSGAALRP